jgi:hypothetical protein
MASHTNNMKMLAPDHNPARRGRRIVIRLKC